MKVLHTGDWHVGRLMRGRSRAGEHRAVLATLASLARAEEVDLILVVGDLFDSAAPGPESERIVWQALLDLAATGARVVVLAGNHDSAQRLSAVTPLLELGRVVCRPVFAKPDDGGVIEVPSRDGQETALVACLPFLSQRWVVKAADLMGGSGAEANLQYADRLRSVLTALTAGFRADTVNLVAAHCMVRGAERVGSERAAHTVFEYSVDSTAFPAGAHYVALGHLHRQQRVPGPCPAYYAGSPLALDFGEVADVKGALVVEASAGRPAQVRFVPLEGGRRLVLLEGSLAEVEAAVVAGAAEDAWVKVRLLEPGRAGLADEVRALVPDVVDIEVVRPDGLAAAGGGTPAGETARVGRAPQDLFAAYLAGRGVEDPRLGGLFAELLDEVGTP
jgi:exonuclease SbcD